MTAAGKEEEIRGATAFRRQSTTPAVRRRVAGSFDHRTTLTSDRTDMKNRPNCSVYSRVVYNSTNLGLALSLLRHLESSSFLTLQCPINMYISLRKGEAEEGKNRTLSNFCVSIRLKAKKYEMGVANLDLIF